MAKSLAEQQKVPSSVLFPEVFHMVQLAMKRYFHVLRLPCVKPLLDLCAEDLTFRIVSLSECEGPFRAPVLIFEELHDFAQVRIDSIIEEWHDNMSPVSDPYVARVFYPKIFEFVREQVLEKEPSIEFLSESDIAALSALVIKNTTIFYKGRNWLSDKRQALRTFKHCFVDA